MRRRHQRIPASEPPPETDLAEAVRARQNAQRAARLSQARRGRVDRIVRTLREIKRVNHLAAALEKIARESS